MRAAVLLGLLPLAACANEQLDAGGDWEPIDAITGELAPEVGPTPGGPRALAGTLRVASWNVHFGEDVEGLAANILASTEISRADVLIVQEIEAYASEPSTRTRRLAEALGMTWFYAPARTEDGGTHGIAILSHFPLEHPEVRELPAFDSSFRARQRNAMRVEVVAGPHRVQLANVHLDLRLGAIDHIRQLDPAVQSLAPDAVIGGDFNSNPWAWVESTVPLTGTEAIVGQDQAHVIDDYMLAQGFPSPLPTDVATMRIPAYDIRIDNIYARGYQVIAAGVEHVDGSDHWPIWADIALPQED